MITVGFTPEFFRRLKKLTPQLQELAFERVDLFRDIRNHQRLGVHKLHGKYRGFFGFSINNKNRIMFEWVSGTEVILHTVGDHSIYD